MTLQAMIKDFQEEMLPNIPKEALALMFAKTEELAKTGIAEKALNVGDRIPEFVLPNHKGEDVKSADLLAQGPLVISFYRGGWCPYCNLELKALQNKLPEIAAAGAQLVAISPQTPDHSLSTVQKNELAFPVLSDVGNGIAKKFGLVFTLDEALRPIYKSLGTNLTDYNGDERFELPIVASYVINQDGVISYAFIDANHTTRAEPATIVEQLKALS